MYKAIKQILAQELADLGLAVSSSHADLLDGIVDRIVAAIQNDSKVLTCVYCGHEYNPGTPPSNHEALTQHIAVCEKHPMKALTDKCTKLEMIVNLFKDMVGEEIFNETMDEPENEITALRKENKTLHEALNLVSSALPAWNQQKRTS